MPNVPITLPDGAINKDVLIDFTTVGSGSNPHNPADYVGGVYPAGRVTIPSGQASVNIPYAFNPDNDVEPDETSTMSFSSPTAGVVISPGSVTLTGLNDDTPPSGDTIVYPVGSDPATTADTGYRQTNTSRHRISGKISDAVFGLSVASNADGSDRIEVRHDGFASVTIKSWTGGAPTTIANTAMFGDNNAIAANTDFSLTHNPADSTITLAVAGQTTKTFGYGGSAAKTGTYARFQHDGGQTATITRLAS